MTATITPSIRGVKKETWHAIKSEAVKHGVTIAKFLDALIVEHIADEETVDFTEVVKEAKKILGKKSK